MPIAPIADRALPAVHVPEGPSRPATSGDPTVESAAPPVAPSGFSHLVHALGREADRGEATVRGVLAGGAHDLAPSELLALQAGIYRYGESIDLASKLVDKAGTDIRTVLQGQS